MVADRVGVVKMWIEMIRMTKKAINLKIFAVISPP